MNEKLKPCPFCNIIPPRVSNGISCMNTRCPMFIVQTYNRAEKETAISDWNTRPIEDELLHQLAEAKGILQDLVDLQNGPPLLQHKQEWELTMKIASDILKVKP